MRRLTPALLGLLLAVPVWGADAAHEWLTKMAGAARRLDYEGTFVYQHGARLDTMRIIHKIVDGTPQERLVALNGVPREIIRDAQEVRCYYPNDNSVVVERRQTDRHKFPSLLPEHPDDLDANYTIQLGSEGRVAGRVAQLVLIRPRDSYRYGYQLWADRDTGLLLKADLVDEKEQMLEQFVFTHIAIGGKIPVAALAPESAHPGMTWRRDLREPARESEAGWLATQMPKGFKLSLQVRREAAAPKLPMEHLVYSDGLAVVSVFIEKQDTDNKKVIEGTTHIGAVNAYGAKIDGHHVTAVGEVPAATTALIGASVARRP